MAGFLDAAVKHYYAAVVAAPEARVWYHNLYQRLEDTGEVPDLSTCKGKLNDDWLEPLFDRHNADERRHSRLWQELLNRRNTFRPDEIPYWANTVAAFCDSGWTSVSLKLSRGEEIHQSELIPMFAGVRALEKCLSIKRFQLMADLHRDIDPEITELLNIIIKDERFHAAYTKKAVMRLGRNNGCEKYAQRCLDGALRSYPKYAVTLMPRYVDILSRKGRQIRVVVHAVHPGGSGLLVLPFNPEVAAAAAGLPGARDAPCFRQSLVHTRLFVVIAERRPRWRDDVAAPVADHPVFAAIYVGWGAPASVVLARSVRRNERATMSARGASGWVRLALRAGPVGRADGPVTSWSSPTKRRVSAPPG